MAEFFFSKYFCWEALFLQDHLTLLGPLFKIFWLTVHHPRRPRGSQSGREKRQDESFQVRKKETLSTDSHRTISKNSSRCRFLIGHKNLMLCIIVPNRRTVPPEFFSWVRTRRLLSRSRLVWLMHQRMHAVRKLSVCYKIPIWFQNTVCPKPKDTFPKIQAWAYNRYSRLHRSRLA